MSRIGLIALLGLAALFFILSELLGDEGDEGILSQIAGSPASENGEPELASPEPPKMPDEVPADSEDDDLADDENLFADDGPTDSTDGFVPAPNITPSGFPAGLENGPPGGQAAPRGSGSGSRANPGGNGASVNEALMRDLAKAGIIDETRKRR